MKIDFMPKTLSGKWSVWLNTFFLIIITASIILVNVFGILSYNDHWWDVTVPVLVFVGIIAFILSVIAIRKSKDRSVLVCVSFVIGLLVILFLLLHSLFIND